MCVCARVCEYAGGVCACIVTHITAPDVQFALQPRLNGGTQEEESQDAAAVASTQKKEP